MQVLAAPLDRRREGYLARLSVQGEGAGDAQLPSLENRLAGIVGCLLDVEMAGQIVQPLDVVLAGRATRRVLEALLQIRGRIDWL